VGAEQFPALPTVDQAVASEIVAGGGLTPDECREHVMKFASHLEAAFRQRDHALGRYSPTPRSEIPDDSPLRRLVDDGITAFRLSDATFRKLAATFAPHVESIRAHQMTKPVAKLKFADNCYPIRPGKGPAEYAMVDALIDELGLGETLSGFAGTKLGPRTLNVQVTRADWIAAHYGEIGADGLPVKRGAYFHVDSEIWPHVKLLIYLTRDVDDQRGPFRYVRGSQDWCTPLELLIRQTNDLLKASRAQYMSLPDAFRMHALFGDDMRPDDPRLDRYLEREWAVTSQDGDVILFDTNGVHRGGFVRSGERVILQVLLGPVG